MEYTRVEATVKRYKKTSKMKKVAKARRRALFLPAPVVAIFMWDSKEERLVVAGMVPSTSGYTIMLSFFYAFKQIFSISHFSTRN